LIGNLIDKMMKTPRNLLLNLLVIFFFGILHSCKQENQDLAVGNQAKVEVTISSLDESEEDYLTKNPEKISSAPIRQSSGSINYSDHTLVEYSWTQDKGPLKTKQNSLKADSRAAIKRKPLGNNIAYSVLVYDDQGNYVTERNYNYGAEGSVAALLLDSEKTYTFLAFSINSTNTLPTIIDKQKLSTVKLSKVAGDLMTFTKQVRLNAGVNLLSIILKHRYSSITTQLTADPTTVGTFNNISNSSIKPAYEYATYSFTGDSFDYLMEKQTGCPVVFPTSQLGSRTMTSTPSFLISPATTTGVLNFGTITIDDETKTNFSIPKIRITPGVSYTLKLNFKTCTENVGSVQGMNWNYPESFYGGVSGIWKDNVFYARGETISRTIIAPGADYGFVFDITELDNAFNMELNGVRLAAREIQFERGASSSQNIRFKDGSLYQGINSEGGNNIGAVYNMKGTNSNPLVKVVIGKKGEVTLFGSKVSGGPLYELELFNGNTFNTFKWNTALQGDNIIKVTQLVDGRTILVGNGSGKKKIPCS